MSDSKPLQELISTISTNAHIVSQYLSDNNLPQPSNISGPSTVLPPETPQHIHRARQALIAASLELSQLAIGPNEYLVNLSTSFQYVSCLRWLCHYSIFHLVPEGSISYDALASAAHVPATRLKSILRMAMTNFLFREVDGLVSHSTMSAHLAHNDDAYAYATFLTRQSAPIALSLTAAHQRWGPDTQETNQTAHNIAFETNLPFFDYMAQNEAMMGEFARYMRGVRGLPPLDFKHLIDGYQWPDTGVVVDVGGSVGDTAIALANVFSQLTFVIQDLPSNVSSGKESAESLPPDISSRLTFQAHDFFQSQPVHNADIYLLRMILHDWPDREAAAIIGKIIPVMKPTSRLLIMDTVLPQPGSIPLFQERLVRGRDMSMMQTLNSKERHLDEWQSLLTLADSTLELVNVVQPFGSALSVLEICKQ